MITLLCLLSFPVLGANWTQPYIDALGQHRRIKPLLPQQPVSRSAYVLFLEQTFLVLPPLRQPAQFDDLPPHHWAYRPLLHAYQSGFLSGTGTHIYPDRYLTRLEVMVSLANGLQLPTNPKIDRVHLLKTRFDDGDQVPPYAVDALSALVHHNIWLTKFLYQTDDGTLIDAYPLLDEWIATRAEEFWRTHVAQGTHDIHISRAEVQQYKMYGLMPIGDTPRKGGWWFHTDLATKKRWYGEPYGGPDTELARPVFVERLEQRIAEMTRLANDPKASIAEVFGDEKTREQQVPIMDGLVNNNEYYAQVNVINNGALPGVPDNVVVEVPAIVNAKGIQPIRVAGLPPKIMWECIWPELLDMERELLAFKTGDKSILLYNVLQSHQTRSYDQGVALLEDLMAMEGNEELRAYFRYPPNW